MLLLVFSINSLRLSGELIHPFQSSPLVCEQALLPLEPAGEAADAVGGDDAVAGNDEGDRVLPVRTADGAAGAALAEARGQLTVGPDLSVGDPLELFPHPQLERRSAQVEVEIEDLQRSCVIGPALLSSAA